jgi:nucleolar protein 12
MASSYQIGALGKLLSSDKGSIKKKESAGIFDDIPQQQLLYKPIKLVKRKPQIPEDDYDESFGKNINKQHKSPVTDKQQLPERKASRKRHRDVSEENVPSENKKSKKKRRNSNIDDTQEQSPKVLTPYKAGKETTDVKKTPLSTGKKQKKSKEARQIDQKSEERTVFVGNLPTTIKKKDLSKIFKSYGKIEAVRLRGAAPKSFNISKKHSVIKKKFHPDKTNINAYVRFSSKLEAEGALGANGVIQDGFHIRVDLATPTKKHDNKRSIFVGNLPFNVTEEAVFEHFAQCGQVDGVRIIRDAATGAGKGFGYVLFKSPDAVEVALHLNERPFMERKIRVKRAINTANNKQNNNKTNKFKPPWKEAKKHKPTTPLSFQGSRSDEVPSKREGKKKKKVKKLKQKKVFFPDVHKKK